VLDGAIAFVPEQADGSEEFDGFDGSDWSDWSGESDEDVPKRAATEAG
jgi:hypothetical protein